MPRSNHWLRALTARSALGLLSLTALAVGAVTQAPRSATLADDAAPLPANEPAEELKGIDLDGRLHRLGDRDGCGAVVVVFLNTECPISNSYVPVLNRLANTFRAPKLEVYGVVSDVGVTREAAVKHRHDFQIQFPILFDASGELRRRLAPTHAPEAFVLTPQGEVRYSGRIDDRYSDLGQKKDKPHVNDLDIGVRAVLAGVDVPTPRTQPIGCPLETAPAVGASGAVTYNRDIAPILLANCVECHRPGEAAPFHLLTYDDASRHAQQIVNVTESRFMPPWHPAPGFGDFHDSPRLSTDSIALIRQWVDAGRPEGDLADRPAAPVYKSGWRLGTPDLVLKMPEAFTVPAEGPDIHQHFVIATGLRTPRLVSAVEFHRGNARVVHHASFYVDTSGAARQLDEADPKPGYGSFAGPGFLNIGSLRSWLPGMTPRRLPPGSGMPLPSHSDLVIEIHYQCSGKEESDQSSVGLYFAPPYSRQLVSEIQVMNKDLEIPAGAARHEHRASFTLPVDATILDACPHMHYLGREMRATATHPDGKVVPLVWIRDWDFNWQGQYLYRDPLRLPKGTRIDVAAWFDNSDGNRLNPHSPPETVRWGEQTHEEMALCHFFYTCETLADMQMLNDAWVRYAREQYRVFLQKQP